MDEALDDKTIVKTLNKRCDDPQHPVGGTLLAGIYKLHDGALYHNSARKIAVGFYPHNEGLGICFFKILPENKYKFVDMRSVPIVDDSEESIRHAVITSRILQQSKSDDDTNSDSFYH